MPKTTSPAISAEISDERDREQRAGRCAREWSWCVAWVTRSAHGAAEREPLGRRRVGEEEQVREPRRREVAEVRAREPTCARSNDPRSRVSSSEKRSACALPAARERGGDGSADELERPARRAGPAAARAATRRAAEQRPEHDARRRRRRHREQRRFATCALAAVAELVRDDELRAHAASTASSSVSKTTTRRVAPSPET